MRYEVASGYERQSFEIPENIEVNVLLPNPLSVDAEETELVRQALQSPIGSAPLGEIVHPGEKIAVITSDVTRPMPTAKVMPALLDELYAAGVNKEDITLVFALGSHRKQTDEEKARLAGERAWQEIRCVDSDPEDCIHMGNTSAGTPVDITRVVAEADKRICLGNIEYHYFAGYSGGRKAIMPGVSTRAAIQANHRMMVKPEASVGRLDNNPLRMDIEEAGGICGVDFILNVVLDEHKRIVKAVAGDSVLAHRAGCAFLDELYCKEIPHTYDIVITSQGGAPKDLNLYQVQKALDNAKHAVKPGGVIILVGSCKEGMGEKVFEEWMTQAPTAKSLIERIGKEFRLGGHKAAAIAMVLEKADIYLVSDLEDAFVRSIFMEPQVSVQEAFDQASHKLREKLMGEEEKELSVLVMPYGGSTLPRVLV